MFLSGDLIISDRWLEGYPIIIDMQDVNDLHLPIGMLRDSTVHFRRDGVLLVDEFDVETHLVR